MILGRLRAHIDKFAELNTVWLAALQLRWLEPINGRWLDQQDHVLGDSSGVYCYADSAGTVLYVGKAQSAMLRARIWHHLGTPAQNRDQLPNRMGPIYPSNEWTLKKRGKESARQIIIAGDFTVIAVEIVPREYASIFEGAALAWAWVEDKELPPLNLKF